MIELKHIHKYYNAGSVSEMCLFDDFNLTIQDGEFVSIVGSNGSGKTSLLNIICGSIGVDRGQILIGGEDITRQKDYLRHRSIGRVYQDPSKGTCGHMTILENMALADNKGKPYNLGMSVKKSREDYYRELLLPLGLGLEDKMRTQVGSLSGGQRQAVALLMATMTPIEMLIRTDQRFWIFYQRDPGIHPLQGLCGSSHPYRTTIHGLKTGNGSLIPLDPGTFLKDREISGQKA